MRFNRLPAHDDRGIDKVRSVSIHTRLSLLVLATAVPLILFALGLVLWHNQTEQESMRQDASRTAGAGMQAIDRELSGAITGLQVLAASPAVAQQDFKAFHAQARSAVGIAGSLIILYDRAGNRIVSTAVRYGAPLPRRLDMSALATPFETGKPHVSQLFISETVKQPTLGIVVPVVVAGEVRYVLAAGLLSQRLSDLLVTSGMPSGWVAALLDQDGTIIARTRNPAEFVGQKAVPDVWRRMQDVKGSAGTVEGVTKEGGPVLLTFARSGESGWMTVVGIPGPVLQGGLSTSLWLVAAAAALVLALASQLAWWAAKRISLPAARLQASAVALEEGKEVRLSPTGIEQFDQLAGAMEHAGRKILEREARLRESFDQLQDAHRQLRNEQSKKDQFIATLAHELRNPLAPIRTGVHILGKSPPAPVASKTLAMMQRQLGHLVRLVDDLLDVSRIARGKVVLQRQDIALQAVVAQAVEAIEPLLTDSGHKLVIQVPDDPVWVNADADRLAQVIVNILNNAIKFSPPGESVTLRVIAAGDDVEIEISDQGIGIPTDKLEEIFETFSQIKDEGDGGQRTGLGIGLSLSKLLIELHGGSIVARSEGRGRGATIVVRLARSAHMQDAPAVADLQGAKGSRALRLLVVDDNQDAADTLATALRISGHSACVAHDGRSALQLAAQSAYDVVMLDIGMPGMDGYEVCRRLRQDRMCADTRIVAVTGWGAAADRQRSKQAGFDAHLTKPVDWEQIVAVLSAASPDVGRAAGV